MAPMLVPTLFHFYRKVHLLILALLSEPFGNETNKGGRKSESKGFHIELSLSRFLSVKDVPPREFPSLAVRWRHPRTRRCELEFFLVAISTLRRTHVIFVARGIWNPSFWKSHRNPKLKTEPNEQHAHSPSFVCVCASGH